MTTPLPNILPGGLYDRLVVDGKRLPPPDPAWLRELWLRVAASVRGIHPRQMALPGLEGTRRPWGRA